MSVAEEQAPSRTQATPVLKTAGALPRVPSHAVVAYKNAVLRSFLFLKETTHIDDLFAKGIPLGDGTGYLVPVAALHGDDDVLLHRFAQWRRENPTRPVCQPAGRWAGKNLDGAENYVILDAEGRGNFVGFVLSVDNIAGGWWGEGDDMIFIDGEEWPPSLHGTGTEEIFGGGACPDREFSGLYAGFHLVSNPDWSGKNGMYRFYVADSIRFAKSIRATIEHGHDNNLGNDYCSVAYWYQDEPHKRFPSLPATADRLPILPEAYRRAEAKDRAAMTLMSAAIASASGIQETKLYEHFAEECGLREALNRAFAEQRYEDMEALADRLISELTRRPRDRWL